MTAADEVWARLPKESAQAFAAFASYRDAGPQRSLTKTARTLSKSRPTLHDWSSKHGWVLRAEAYDADVDRAWLLDQATARRACAARQAAVAGKMIDAVLARLQSLDPAELTVADLCRFLDVAARVERSALGEPTRLELAGPDGGAVRLEIADTTAEERQARLGQLRSEITRRLEDLL